MHACTRSAQTRVRGLACRRLGWDDHLLPLLVKQNAITAEKAREYSIPPTVTHSSACSARTRVCLHACVCVCAFWGAEKCRLVRLKFIERVDEKKKND
jgi:hypothetical protein